MTTVVEGVFPSDVESIYRRLHDFAASERGTAYSSAGAG